MSHHHHHHKRSRPSNDSGDEDGKSSNFSKRRRCTESMDDVERRLEAIICKVGEKTGSSLETALESVAGVLENDIGSYKQQILEIVMLCSYQLPEKTTIYTTLTGLLNLKKSDCGADLIDMIVPELKRLIVTNQFQFAENVIRFLSDLCNCYVVKPATILDLLNSFVSVCKQQESPQARKDWYIYATLAALPWAGGILQEKYPAELETLFFKIGRYMGQRKKLHHEFLRVWSTDDPHPQEESLDCLYAQINKLKEDNWVEDIILRPYRAFDCILKESFQHSVPNFVVPPHVEESSLYPVQKVVFRMFDYTDCPDRLPLPGNHAIERWLIEDAVRNMISTYRLDKKECAARLLLMFDHDKIPVFHILVECLFSDMFRLPVPTNPLVFYTTLFIELCRLQPNKMPQVLALATDMLFERLDNMNVTCADRFVNWFSHHLSNFQFTWSWEEWGECLDSDLALPQPKFIKEVLEKCMRLAYYKKVHSMVPEKFEQLCPVEPLINFKYVDEIIATKDTKLAFTPAQKMVSSIKKRATNEDIMVSLEQMIPSYGPDGEVAPNYDLQRVEVFTECLFFLAKKSFSHSFSALSKYHKVLKWAADKEAGKAEVLRVTHSVWKNHTLMMAVLVDKMLRLQIVNCSAVAEWLFSPDMGEEFTRMYVWEIMHSTIRRMQGHLLRLESEYNEVKEKSQIVEPEPDQDESRNMMDTYNAFAPDQGDVKKLNNAIDSAREEQKRLFFTIFNSFKEILSEHLKRCEASKVDFNNPWYKNTLDRLKEVFLLHGPIVKQYNQTLEFLFKSEDLDPRIRVVFEQYISLGQ